MKPKPTPKPFERGAQIVVHAKGLVNWFPGTVLGCKWSNQTGWWVEVRRDDGAGVAVPAGMVSAA